PVNLLASGNNRQTACGGHTQAMHGLTHYKFANSGAKGAAAVTLTGKCGGSRAFQLNINSLAINIKYLAKQMRAAVSKLWTKMTKLMATIGKCDGCGAFRYFIPRKILGN